MDYGLSMAPRAGDPQFLGPPPAPEVRRQLEALARTAEPTQAEAILREALELDPYCMDTYHAFCRLFIRQGRLRDAENAALAALSVAASASGMDPDWRVQRGNLYYWRSPGHAERYYLAALQTLATVRRLQGHIDEHQAILSKLTELGMVPERNRAFREQKAA